MSLLPHCFDQLEKDHKPSECVCACMHACDVYMMSCLSTSLVTSGGLVKPALKGHVDAREDHVLG